MIVNEPGVILSRRNLGEADRLCNIFTENMGKVSSRFVGVNKPRRKMKALSEPMVWAEFRLYTSPRSEIAKVIGGAIVSTFPDTRSDLDSTVASFSCCERLDALTPWRSPNPDKYRLICSALAAIEAKLSPWVQIAFHVQLLEMIGHSMREREVLAEHRLLWLRLHDTAIDALDAVPWRPEAAEIFMRLCDDETEGLIGRALKTRDYAKRLAAPLEAAHA
jgi:hypothetical protein